MISVTYEPGIPRLTLTGHAEHAPRGRDIVCAAASILAYTLTAGGAEAEELRGGGLRLTGGRRDLELIAGGYRLLAENYPQNIRFEVNE